MQDTSTFRTTLTEFKMLTFVEGEILFVTINTPVIFGSIVVTTTGVDTEPFFSKTTVVVIVEVDPFSSVSVLWSDSVKYWICGVDSIITITDTELISLISFSIDSSLDSTDFE